MRGLYRLNVEFAGFPGFYAPFNRLFDYSRGVPRAKREWSSDTPKTPLKIRFLFDQIVTVDEVRADIVSSDQTADQFVWELFFTDPKGERLEEPMLYDNDRNIGRGGDREYPFSLDNDPVRWPLLPEYKASRVSMPRLRRELDEPVRAVGGELTIKSGHGCFLIRGLEFWGREFKTADAGLMQSLQQDIRTKVGDANCWTR